MNEPIFSSLTGKGTGFFTAGDQFSPSYPWTAATGTFCPAGTFDGTNYYINDNNGSGYNGWVMFRENGYWYVSGGLLPGTEWFGGPPHVYIQSNSSTPPLSGWEKPGGGYDLGNLETAIC